MQTTVRLAIPPSHLPQQRHNQTWVAVTPDGEKKFAGATYYIYAERKWELVGSDPAEAVSALEKRQGELLVAAATAQQPVTLSQAFDLWLEDVQASGADDR